LAKQGKLSLAINKDKKVKTSYISLPIPSCPNKETLIIWKKQGKLASKYANNPKPTKPKLYTQALAMSINNRKVRLQ